MTPFHAITIELITYAIFYGNGVPQDNSENRSVAIEAVVLVYMILFGHGELKEVNKALF